LGYAAGASYGPDLTTLFDNYGEEGVAGVLEDLSFESMNAIYADRPLTEVERADLVAFFRAVSQDKTTHPETPLTLHAAIATALFMVLIGLLGWRRLQGVRKPLIEKARYGKGEIA
jgi:hypothetical protein